MTDVAVVGFAHAPHVRRTDGTTNGVEMLMPCFASIYAELGLKQTDIGFWCSGSSDYLAGRAFSFISAIDSIGAVPPINESHVEMDAAWALYEAYIKLLTGEIDTVAATRTIAPLARTGSAASGSEIEALKLVVEVSWAVGAATRRVSGAVAAVRRTRWPLRSRAPRPTRD